MGTPYQQMTPEQKSAAHARTKKWKEKNKERVAGFRHTHYMENRDKYLHLERERAYQQRYGIGLADYDRMLAEQGGACWICKRDQPSLNKRFRFFAVDHDHRTGKVRGLLCQKCNGALGWFERHWREAEKYLERASNG